MKNNTFIKGFRKYFKQNLGILIGLFLLCTVVSFMNENFLTTGNIMNVLRQLFINANLSLGMCLVIITGGIDLTVGSTMGLCGTLTAGLIALNGLNIWLAILIGLLLGVLIGAVNGYIITKLDIAPFIVTMAVQMISRGAVYVYTDGLPIRSVQETFNNLGNGYIKGVPVTILYTVFFTIVVWLILSRSRLGRHIYAVGGNRIAAQYSGISITKVNVWVYAISGFLAAFAGIIY
jgi:ribose transport system permease protein